jgi:hypothetical protein
MVIAKGTLCRSKLRRRRHGRCGRRGRRGSHHTTNRGSRETAARARPCNNQRKQAIRGFLRGLRRKNTAKKQKKRTSTT